MTEIEKTEAIERLTRDQMCRDGLVFDSTGQRWEKRDTVRGTPTVHLSETDVASTVAAILAAQGASFTPEDVTVALPALRLARSSVRVNEPVQPIEARPYR